MIENYKSYKLCLRIGVLCSLLSVLAMPLHGQFLKVSENNRFLVTDEGQPFFWTGDTAWELIHRLDSTQVVQYIENRKKQGFNIFQTVIIGERDGLRTPNVYGEVPLHDLDPEKPNEAFFKFVDYVVDKAAEMGMYVAIEPTWAIHVIDLPQWKNLHVFTPENGFSYGKFLGKRYGDKWNVVWMLGGDTDPTEAGRIDIWEQIALGLKIGSKNKQLITYHPSGYGSSVDYIHDKPWLDFNGIQVGHARRNNIDADFVRRAWDKKPPKPVLNLESTYEGISPKFKDQNGRFDAYDVRKSAYWSVFSGSLGYTYGHHAIWQMYYGDDKFLFSDPGMGWKEAMNAPGSQHVGYLRKLMESRPQLQRKPDLDIVLQAHSKEPRLGQQSDRLVALRDGTDIAAKDATYIMVYSPIVKKVKVDTRIIGSDSLKVWWYNPSKGTGHFIEKIENTGDITVDPSKHMDIEDGPDWVMVVDSASAEYKAPGTQSIIE